MINQIFNGDCLEVMKGIPDKSIDLILCDLPYGTTSCKWDIVIPFEPLWEQYNRIIKNNGAIVLFGSQPFTSLLIGSNLKMFKYEWIWEKTSHSNPQLAKKQPLKIHENVCVFYKKFPTYNPQGIIECEILRSNKGVMERLGHFTSDEKTYIQKTTNYPKSIQKFKKDVGLHPTQKPVPLLEYLIKTYSNEKEIVLDNCMGSGSTIIACINTNRQYIGMEMDKEIFEVAKNRIHNHCINIQNKP